MNKQALIGSVGALVIAIVAAIIYVLTGSSGGPVITDHTSCAQAGNAVTLTYPEQCVTKDGRTFIQPAATETASTTLPAY